MSTRDASMPPIQSPAELKKLTLTGLELLADELRQVIVATCLRNGGHLGASLGPVELAIALHFVFDSPSEPIVWDVGHQAYAHKLLTGRWQRFHTLRQEGGLSGFLTREESEHDAFGAGHSSTALSAALAMSYARRGTDRWTVAVVGDGGLTAGVALEALNNAKASTGGPFIAVLNDNQMSISANVGALSQIFGSGQAGEFFELFGFEYVGPVDGHHLGELIGTLQGLRARGSTKPILLHALTQKGKGYVPAEENPASYHGVSPVVEKVVGRPASPKQRGCSEVFGHALCEMAEQDPKIVAITAAMPEGTGLTEFARRFPERFFDVGIAEPHAVTFAAGLATQGFKPVVAIYSTFLQRGLDAIIHDVALQNLGVTFAIDRAGLVGADGPTHHGMFDLAYLGMVPNLNISAPASLEDLVSSLKLAVGSGKPWAIRYPRGSLPESSDRTSNANWGWAHQAVAPQVIAIAVGSTASRVSLAARAIDPQGNKISTIVLSRIKPLDPQLLAELKATPHAALLIAEEGVVRGGVGEAVLGELGAHLGAVDLAGYPDQFVRHGSPAALESQVGLSAAALETRLRELLGEKAD